MRDVEKEILHFTYLDYYIFVCNMYIKLLNLSGRYFTHERKSFINSNNFSAFAII